ncbi:MATE family efflux transporter [Microbacterium phyllosphaerae]|uniref:MATE family efflux transporter n=1 Tax=Microbacterium phyllosphaerae TaxID=124798 RepID=UPI002167230F|nr:MATE family efflux transporter [Microbacterium phyllosphaerae]MCS3442997.1 putative MATE family efflux protein [Microbacterium phyllosphaerae]
MSEVRARARARALLEGPPWRAILRFIVPIWIGNVIQQSHYTVDALILGRFVGEHGLAAVGSSFGLVSLLFGTVFAFTAGLTIQIAQAHGAGDAIAVGRRFWTGSVIAVGGAVLIGALLAATAPIVMTLIGVPMDIRSDATTFYLIFCVGLPLTAFGNFCTHTIRGLGDSTSPTVVMLISGVVNALLALWLVGGAHLGVLGAGLATQGAGLCTALVSFLILLRSHPHLRVRTSLAPVAGGTQGRQGAAMAFQSAGIGAGNVLLQAAANSLGAAAIAGVSIGLRVEGFALAPLAAFGICMVVYCAQNAGAEDMGRVRRGVRQASVMCIALAAIEGIVVILLAGRIAQAFLSSSDPTATATATTYLQLSAVFYPVIASVFLLRASLQGVSISRPAVLSGLGELVAKSLCAGLTVLGGGILAIALSGPASWLVALIPLALSWCAWRRSSLRGEPSGGHPRG